MPSFFPKPLCNAYVCFTLSSDVVYWCSVIYAEPTADTSKSTSQTTLEYSVSILARGLEGHFTTVLKWERRDLRARSYRVKSPSIWTSSYDHHLELSCVTSARGRIV